MLARLIATITMVLTLGLALPAHAQSTRVLDSFDDLSPWTADASTDVSSTLTAVPGRIGQAMRLNYDFNGRSGYAFAARTLSFEAPENYELSFWVRGDTLPNTFEIKFTDAGGENVHWRQITRYDFPGDWTLVTVKKRQIIWAWGPNPDRTFRGSERIEFVVVAGEGGRGWIEIDQLTLRTLPREPSVPPRPIAEATTAEGLATPALAVDGDLTTAWRTTGVGEQSLTLDLGYEREFGGLTLRWLEGLHAASYRIMASTDNRDWRELAAVTEGDGGTDWLRTPEAQARWLRLDLREPAGSGNASGQMGAGQMLGDRTAQAYALAELEIEPLSFGETDTKFLTAIATESRRGHYPRGFKGEQPYWTLVGVDGGGESGLISEDGAIELRRGGPSIEPFVLDNGRLVTWADVRIDQGLIDDDLPIPTVTWTHDDWTLRVTSFAEGMPDASRLYGRYDLTNTSPQARTLRLALAARPLQVNGPVQFLTVPGGASPIQQIDWTGGELVLNDAIRVQPLATPTGVVMSRFEAGSGPQSLLARRPIQPPTDRLVESDTGGLMAGAMTWDVTLQPGQTWTVGWHAPMAGVPIPPAPAASIADTLDGTQARVAGVWREKMDRFDLIVPPQGQRIEDTMKSSVAHMLMSRQGARIQPGTRSYNRSWIRDGSMQAEGLNRVGHPDIGADYLRWYAPYQFESGKIPCCVDDRGADPVPENDSHGQFIFLAAETWRFTRDEALLRETWPRVQRAIAYMDSLRASTRTAENMTPDRRHYYGLLPPTISHEGYSDKPAWSFWDDFWGLLGYSDAIDLARAVGDEAAAARITASRDQFAADINAAITGTALHHRIDWIAGAADRGDFDATSTTIALSPAGLQSTLPQGLMKRTFEKYWENFTARRSNQTAWRDYTPYELRNVGALVRLGERDRAMQALDFFFADRRPQAWNGWAEVVGRDLRDPRFIGDMPHAWISSDYIRSALDMFVYERDSDQALVLAAGLPLAWVDSETGIGVRDVRTPYGPLSYLFKRERAGRILTIDSRISPPGGYVLQWPEDEPVPERTRIDGRGAEWEGRELTIPAGARRVELR